MVGNRDLKILGNESEVSNQGSVLNFEMVGQAEPNPAEGHFGDDICGTLGATFLPPLPRRSLSPYSE